jgi:hypothetical protein
VGNPIATLLPRYTITYDNAVGGGRVDRGCVCSKHPYPSLLRQAARQNTHTEYNVCSEDVTQGCFRYQLFLPFIGTKYVCWVGGP